VISHESWLLQAAAAVVMHVEERDTAFITGIDNAIIISSSCYDIIRTARFQLLVVKGMLWPDPWLLQHHTL
jgi:hypothetical protein